MYFNIDDRNLEYRNNLKNFIENSYSLKIISINEYNRGFYGETWKIECIKNNIFFVKIIYFEKQAKKYRKCFEILDFMKDNGIDFVSQVIKTTGGNHYVFLTKELLHYLNLYMEFMQKINLQHLYPIW
jgi:DNA gyrase/topoisomerase IV subunit B